MAPATEKQEAFIKEIALYLNVCEPTHLTKSEASHWISTHIKPYEQMRDIDAEMYYDSIIND